MSGMPAEYAHDPGSGAAANDEGRYPGHMQMQVSGGAGGAKSTCTRRWAAAQAVPRHMQAQAGACVQGVADGEQQRRRCPGTCRGNCGRRCMGGC